MIADIAPKIDVDFTDEQLTATAGLAFVGQLNKQLKLPQLLSEGVKLKRRHRGSSDTQMLLSLIYSFCAGHGHLSDVDTLKADTTAQRILGLNQVPDSRRLGAYLSTFDESSLEALQGIVRHINHHLAPKVIAHHTEQQSYIPVFMDGTAIEVSGRLFEQAAYGYNHEQQYWLHGIFIGGLWIASRLHPGGVDVAQGWREQLDEMAPLFQADDPVWLRLDHAYYRGELVHYCQDHGWDYSISLTDPRKRQPVLEQIEGLAEGAWQDIGLGEQALFAYHQPAAWKTMQSYVVIRRTHDGKQKRVTPAYTVILVSTDTLPLAELVKRHRGKQGQENAFKGPLIDLDLHHPPCRSFKANQAFYLCGHIAHSLLRGIQFELLPNSARQHGIRPIIRYLICTAARWVKSARQLQLRFAKTARRLDWIYFAACRLE